MAYHLSIFVQNKPGQLEKITKILADNGINLKAFSVASAGDFGVAKALVNDAEKAYQLLQAENVTVSRRKILIAKMPDRPGGLHQVLSALSLKQINIEDCYGFVLEAGKEAAVVLEVEKYPLAEEILRTAGISLMTDEEVDQL